MMFIEALMAAQGHSADALRVFRPDGPAFTVDHLGQVRGDVDCA